MLNKKGFIQLQDYLLILQKMKEINMSTRELLLERTITFFYMAKTIYHNTKFLTFRIMFFINLMEKILVQQQLCPSILEVIIKISMINRFSFVLSFLLISVTKNIYMMTLLPLSIIAIKSQINLILLSKTAKSTFKFKDTTTKDRTGINA
jgi:hypothetical protein